MDSLYTPKALPMAFCNTGDKNDIPQAPTGTNKASLSEGFPPITALSRQEGGIPPNRLDFNGAMNLNSQFYFAFQNGWLPTFNTAVSQAIGGYPLGAVLWNVTSNGVMGLRSAKGNNTDNFITDPSVIGTSWLQVFPSKEYVDGAIQTAIGQVIPVGSLCMGPLSAAPAGYLLCDGTAVSRTQYAALFAVLGVNFGGGDGSTTFNLPDYRGCFLRGQGGASGTLYEKQPMGAPDATGHIVLGWQNGEYAASGVFTKKVDGYVSPDGFKNYNSGYDFALSTSNSVYGAAEEIRPVNFAVNYFIKY